jgi:hypothetical protein
VQSDYQHDPDRPEYQHLRKVAWRGATNLKLPKDARVPIKTLTETTDKTPFVEFVTENLLEALAAPSPTIGAPTYTLDAAMSDLFLTRPEAEAILAALQRKKNVILQGSPGVGKTYAARRLADAFLGQQDPRRFALVQFHQSYAYEDFIQGYRPSEDGFKRRDGVFFDFCNRARQDIGRPYVFAIDEINRGNLSKIFGELMMLIEADKRGSKYAIRLTYSEGDDPPFSVPENVHILGMMNTADRSLALVDYALRRRFVFFTLTPQFASTQLGDHLGGLGAPRELVERIRDRMTALNQVISADKDLGPGFAIGHSFFCPPGEAKSREWGRWYDDVIEQEIAPLLCEYWFDDPKKAEREVRELKAR